MKTYLLIILILICGIGTFGQVKRIDVSVDINAADIDSKNLIESYISRELRSLNYVNEIADGGFYKFKIASVKNKDRAIYSIAVVLLRQADCVSEGKTNPCYIYASQSAYLASEETLRKVCEDIVTSFDIRLKPIIKAK